MKFKNLFEKMKKPLKVLTIICLIFFLLDVALLTAFTLRFNNTVMMKPGGGIGNQLFQFSAAYSFAKQNNKKLYIISQDLQQEDRSKDPLNRSYVLNHFNIKGHDIDFIDDFWSWLFKRVRSNKFNSLFLNKLFNIVLLDEQNFFEYKNDNKDRTFILAPLHGYFESEIFFKDFKNEIIERLLFSNIDINKIYSTLEEIKKPNSVCVHVRKGDMMNIAIHKQSEGYTQEAMRLAEYINPRANFFIFSDSIDIVKKELGEGENVTFISDQISGLESLFLMTHCNNSIVANSTFSWWGSYLNKNKTGFTIAPIERYDEALYDHVDPKLRYKFKSLYKNDAYPKDWVLLDVHNNYIKDIITSLKLSIEQSEYILKDYYHKKFNIYTGDKQELDVCNDQGRKFFCKPINKKKPTVVSAYYEIRSKYSAEDYDTWMQNFLKIPFNLVLYTDERSAPKIKKYRKDLPIKIIIKSIEEFYHYKFYDQYRLMYSRDANKNHSPELYLIWAEKVKFVKEAVEKNYYGSDFFIWSDIGVIRDSGYWSANFPQSKYMLYNKMLFTAIKEFDSQERQDKLMKYGGKIVRVGGSIQCGDRTAWRLYDVIWDKTLNYMIENNIDAGNDQRVMGTIALRYPDLVNLIYPKLDFKGNNWWYSLILYSQQ